MGTILEDIKQTQGVTVGNLGFDGELLIHINASVSELAQLGVSEFDDLEIESTTPWPAFGNTILTGLIKQYMAIDTRAIFDPIASATIADAFESQKQQLAGRIQHEVEVINAGTL